MQRKHVQGHSFRHVTWQKRKTNPARRCVRVCVHEAIRDMKAA